MRRIFSLEILKEENKCRWENRMDLREIGWEVVDWIHLAQ